MPIHHVNSSSECAWDHCLQKKIALVESIKNAFSNVTLGNGVGLFEGQGLDDYAAKEALALLRSKDEKINWDHIPVEQLNECYSSLSFFDAEGMRFHLPAFMLAEVDQTDCSFDITFHLIQPVMATSEELKKYAEDQFSLLNVDQKKVVRLFLQFYLDRHEGGVSINNIQQALGGFWE